MYGPAQDEPKADFLREMVNLAKDNPHPLIIGGDFNLLRFPFEKSKGCFDNHWPFLFNAVIDSLDLREVTMIGRQFTAKKTAQKAHTDLKAILDACHKGIRAMSHHIFGKLMHLPSFLL